MSRDYEVGITAGTVAGERGYWYSVSFQGREVFGGWSRGAKSNAMAEVSEGINAREALRSLTLDAAMGGGR